jgi:hypothetical protein
LSGSQDGTLMLWDLKLIADGTDPAVRRKLDRTTSCESENVPFQSGDLRDNPLRRYYSDGIKRYSVGILVFMIGVMTPFT